MDLKSSHASPVLTDPVPVNKSRLGMGMHSGLISYSQQDSSSLSSSHSPVKYSRNNSSRKSSGNLDDVRSNGWLDAMKASSPPRKKMPIKGFNSHTDTQDDYHSWLVDYPSALESFEDMIKHAKDKKIAMFFDYDGTLSPIVDDPDCAFMSEDMRSVVRNVAKCFPTAVISGRSRDKVFDLVKLTELYYAGSHGMDIIGPACQTLSNNSHPHCVKSTDQQGKEITLFQPAREFLPLIDEVFNRLVETTKDIQGAKVEHHKFCVSVHYRNVEENNWTVIGQLVHDLLKDYPLLRSRHGRKVLEIRPVIDWNKGKAVEFLLECLGLSEGNDDVLAIYIGDDKTDEDAFKVLRESKGGYGVLVSSTRKQSNAFYSLRDPSEVMKFLEMLVNWKREEESKHQRKRHLLG